MRYGMARPSPFPPGGLLSSGFVRTGSDWRDSIKPSMNVPPASTLPSLSVQSKLKLPCVPAKLGTFLW